MVVNRNICQSFIDSSSQNASDKFPSWKMKLLPTKSLERNSRLSVAMVKNKAEEHYLNIELNHLEKEKQTALRMLQNDKHWFKLKYDKSNFNGDGSHIEALSKYYIPSFDKSEDTIEHSIGDTGSINYTLVEFQQIHNLLFTNDEVDIEKILCLHLISAHRTESLAPARKKLAYMCKIHSPLERLLERSKRKNIHQEQRMTNMLPIYTIETTEFGTKSEPKDLINDGRLATRILLNEKVRELINAVLSALKQANPEKNYDIFELANDIGCLKKLFTKRTILDFLEDLMNCPLITSCESFILTAPFRVKSNQLEIRTRTGTLELLVKQIRQNVLQLPARTSIKSENFDGEEGNEKTNRRPLNTRTIYRKRMAKRKSSEETSKNIQDLYTDKQARLPLNQQKKLGRHVDVNFIQKNKEAAANVKKVEYDTDEDDVLNRSRRSSQGSNRSRRSSEASGSIADRPNIQPIRLSEEVNVIMEEKDLTEDKRENDSSTQDGDDKSEYEKEKDRQENPRFKRRKSSTDSENIKIHLKQTTCPACMERYKIPLPIPKTPRIKASSVLPTAPGENPDLKTNSKNRISMLINKEMFKLQSYERRFSSEENSRRNSLKKAELESCSSNYLNLSPLELAKIEQEVREKETQKKLEKFLQSK